MNRRVFLQTTATAAVTTALPRGGLAQSPQKTPFLGTWLYLHYLSRGPSTRAQREQAIDVALDGHLSAGLRTVMPFVTSTSGGAHFPSRIIKPRREGDWDPLDYLIKGAEKRDLEVYPAFSSLVCGHLQPAGVLLDHPEWASRHPDGKPMGHICPTHPAARDWVTSVVADVVKRYPTRGIMLDYLRYYNRPSRLDGASEADFATWKKAHADVGDKQALQMFREEGISKLAKQISETARDHRPGIKVAIYSWGPHVANDHQVAQPWPSWSRDGLIDQVSVSGYCYPDNYGAEYLDVFSRRLGDAVKLNQRSGGRAQMTFSLGVRTSHGKIREARWINDYLTRAADQGVTGVSVFTWEYLQPYLKQAIRDDYFPAFAKRLSG